MKVKKSVTDTFTVGVKTDRRSVLTEKTYTVTLKTASATSDLKFTVFQYQ